MVTIFNLDEELRGASSLHMHVTGEQLNPIPPIEPQVATLVSSINTSITEMVPFVAELESLNDFNPPEEPTKSKPSFTPRTEKTKLVDFGSIEQFSDLVIKYSKIVIRQAVEKAEDYPIGTGNVLALLLNVADDENVSPWSTWRSWMKRHLLPVLEMTRDDVPNSDAFERRMCDLLGYIFMGLQLLEHSKQEGYEEAWNYFRSLGTK